MISLRTVLRKSSCQLRQFHKCVPVCQVETSLDVEKLAAPVPEGVESPVSPKIDKIASDITALNLIEVAELSNLLKKRLNLPDAPVMPMGGFAPAPKEEEEVEIKKVKSSFTVKLVKFDDKQKIPLIKEIKNLIPGMNLVQSKKFVESLPNIVKADISKDEADQLQAAIVKAGGEVTVE